MGRGTGERRVESQIKVVKRRRNGGVRRGWGGGRLRNNRRATDQIFSDRTREEDGCREGKRERGGGERDENIYAVASVVRQGRLLSL